MWVRAYGQRAGGGGGHASPPPVTQHKRHTPERRLYWCSSSAISSRSTIICCSFIIIAWKSAVSVAFCSSSSCTCGQGGGGAVGLPSDAFEGKGPQRRPQKRSDRRLEEVATAVGGGYCRLQMPLKPALGVRETVVGRRLGALEGGGWGDTSPRSNASLGLPLLLRHHLICPVPCSLLSDGCSACRHGCLLWLGEARRRRHSGPQSRGRGAWCGGVPVPRGVAAGLSTVGQR